jgi:hypothetical protein
MAWAVGPPGSGQLGGKAQPLCTARRRRGAMGLGGSGCGLRWADSRTVLLTEFELTQRIEAAWHKTAPVSSPLFLRWPTVRF